MHVVRPLTSQSNVADIRPVKTPEFLVRFGRNTLDPLHGGGDALVPPALARVRIVPYFSYRRLAPRVFHPFPLLLHGQLLHPWAIARLEFLRVAVEYDQLPPLPSDDRGAPGVPVVPVLSLRLTHLRAGPRPEGYHPVPPPAFGLSPDATVDVEVLARLLVAIIVLLRAVLEAHLSRMNVAACGIPIVSCE